MTTGKPRTKHEKITERYRCNLPDCDQPTDVNDAVWWTPFGSACTEQHALALVKEKREAAQD